MARPKFFRDPVHVQLRFAPVDLTAPIPQEGGDNRRSWLLRKLIDCPEFQRLRFNRQNGLAITYSMVPSTLASRTALVPLT